MILTDRGLDLDFSETKKSLNIPVKPKKSSRFPYRFSQDPKFEKLGQLLAINDMQQYISRFTWHNLPEGMDSELIEKIMYFSGSGMFFYMKEVDKFYFLPYGMSGQDEPVGIDFYGRFNKVKPYSFNGATQESKKHKSAADILLSTQVRNNIRDIPLVSSEEEARKIYNEGAVLLFDYTPGLAYMNEARNRTSKPLIEYMIDVLIQTQSAMINASGFNLFTASNESDRDIMQLQIDTMNLDRKIGKLSGVVSSEGIQEIQNLQSNSPAAMADFWNTFMSVDNLRKSTMGINNDGVVQKSQYQSDTEQMLDISTASQVYYNSFVERLKFAAIVNSIWGLDIYPEPNHISFMQGMNLPGQEVDSQEQAQGGTNNEN